MGAELARGSDPFDGDGLGLVFSPFHSLASSEHLPSIPVSVFADGFMLYRGPFQPFGTAEATPFLAQAMAGYLPHELVQRHPRGFAFEVHDFTSRTHAEACAEAAAGRCIE